MDQYGVGLQHLHSRRRSNQNRPPCITHASAFVVFIKLNIIYFNLTTSKIGHALSGKRIDNR